MEKSAQGWHPERCEKIQVSARALNHVTQAKVISMRATVYLYFTNRFQKERNTLGLVYRARAQKKCHRESSMSRGSESGKNSEILLKAAGSSLRTPGGCCGRQGARGWLARPLVIFGGQPVFKYEPFVRVREEKEREGACMCVYMRVCVFGKEREKKGRRKRERDNGTP